MLGWNPSKGTLLLTFLQDRDLGVGILPGAGDPHTRLFQLIECALQVYGLPSRTGVEEVIFERAFPAKLFGGEKSDVQFTPEARYWPSRNPFADTPATLAQARRLTNAGIRSEFTYSRGRHASAQKVLALRAFAFRAPAQKTMTPILPALRSETRSISPSVRTVFSVNPRPAARAPL
jgi:hypothetical protein